MPPQLHSFINDDVHLDVLADYAVLDTPAEPGFDDIVHLACRLCAVPAALISLVVGDRLWLKARVGFAAFETDLNSSVCAHALAQPDRLLIIPDLAADPRTSGNPLVTGEPFIRFYAGAPLVNSEGHVLGSLCAIDRQPRPEGLTQTQADDLRALARQVMSQLELRRAVAARDAANEQERRSYRVREALRDTQIAVVKAAGDPDSFLEAIVRGAMLAVPAAEGGAIEIITGDILESRATLGTLSDHRGSKRSVVGSQAGRWATIRTPHRVTEAATDEVVRQDLLEPSRLTSAIVAPIMRGDDVLGMLKLQAGTPDAFTEGDLELIGLFAGEANTGLAAADARQALHAQDIYWRGLFDRLSEGFVIGEAVRDDAGRMVDWRYVEVNPAIADLAGVMPADLIGRTVRTVFPGIEDSWITDFAEVIDTGEPAGFARQVGVLQRWYEGRAFKLDGERFGVIFLEVTGRVQAESRRSALLALGDRLRDLTTIPDMTRAAAEIVGRTLGAIRAGFGRIEGDMEVIDIEPDWTMPGVASIAGRHLFDDYGNLSGHLRRGTALVIDDVATDPRTRDDPAPMRALGVAALVNMPVRERGRTVAVFFAHDVNARTWTSDELGFLRNVADRVEVGVARVRAEDLQTVLNNELAHRLKNTLAVVQSIATQTLRGVTERDKVQAFDRRLLALSRAHDVLLQKSWSAARLRAVMESVLTLQADLDRFALNGQDMDIGPQAALSLSMLLHELATNAVKYGSLSADGGIVRIAWRTDKQGKAPALVLDWTERGGPAVVEPTGRTGFGSKLIRLGLLGTRAAILAYEPVGLRAEFRAPLADIQMQIH